MVTVGGFPFCCLSALPLAYFPAPIPLTPFPTGRGRFFCFLMQGASPLASPRLSRKRHRLTLRSRYPAEACPAGRRLTPPLWCPQGACLPCRLPTPPLAYFPAPIPLTPFPTGRGRFFCFLMQGASPLASPRLNPGGTGSTLRKPILFGVAGERRLQSIKISRKVLGGLGASFKKPPSASPPLASPGAEPGRHWLNFKKPILLASPENAGCSQ